MGYFFKEIQRWWKTSFGIDSSGGDAGDIWRLADLWTQAVGVVAQLVANLFTQKAGEWPTWDVLKYFWIVGVPWWNDDDDDDDDDDWLDVFQFGMSKFSRWRF